MDAEERHELKENDLANWIYRVPALARDYGSYVLFGLALCLLGWQLYRWYSAEQDKKVQNAWTELTDASGNFFGEPADPNKLRTIINEYDIRPVKALAYTALGDFYLDALNLGESPQEKLKVTGTQARQESFDAYNRVVNEFPDQSLALIRSRLGIGRLCEYDGQWDKAREQYEKLTGDPKLADNPLTGEAQRRLDHLKDWSQPVIFGSGPATQPDFTLPNFNSMGPMGPTLPPTAPTTAPATPTMIPPVTPPAVPASAPGH